jgi:hypothetical protein
VGLKVPQGNGVGRCAEPRMFVLQFPHLTVVLPVAEKQRTVVSFLILLRF